MSAPNFKTMQDFPLIVAQDEYSKFCPHCLLGQDPENDKCEGCGADLTEVESEYDECLMTDRIREMEKVAKELNDQQEFYEVTVESGYYSGVQFYVEEKCYDIENWTNDDAQYEFGVCKSEMLHRYKVAENTIRRGLAEAKDELGLIELLCVGRFSNGEAVYEDADNKRAQLKAAVAA